MKVKVEENEMKELFLTSVQYAGLFRTLFGICLISLFYIITLITMVLLSKKLIVDTKNLLTKKR